MDLAGLISAPTLSMKAGTNTYIGASLLLGWESLKTTLPTPDATQTTPPTGTNTNEDTATGYGLKMGITTQDSDGHQFGAFFQTRIDMGAMEEHCTDDGLMAGYAAGGGDCSLNLPPMLGVGVALKASSSSKIVMDFVSVKWASVSLFRDAFQWHDQNILKIGFENKSSASFTWRIGYNHGDSPIKDQTIAFLPPGATMPVAPGVIAPAVTEDHFSFGFSKKMAGGNELVGYYAYIPENEQVDPDGFGVGGNPVKVKMSQHALGIGYNWK